MPRLLLILLLVASLAQAAKPPRYVDTLPPKSVVIPGYSREKAELRTLQSAVLPEEGLYLLTSDGSVVSLESWHPTDRPRDNMTYLRLVAVKAANRSIRPGTVLGYLAPTAKKGTYDARIYTTLHGNGTFSSPKSFRLERQTDGSLIFNKVEHGVIFSWLRILTSPLRYRYRSVVDYRPHDRDGMDGLVPLASPLPRYF